MNDYRPLASFLRENEGGITERFLNYTKDRGYQQFVPIPPSVWNLVVRGMNKTLIDAAESGISSPEHGPRKEYPEDPVTQFGVIEARLHRSRGITLPMFLGLFMYLHQAFADSIEDHYHDAERIGYRYFMDRVFETVQLGLITEWTSDLKDDLIIELQQRNREMMNEKNRFITIFENLPEGVIILDSSGRPTMTNQIYADLFLDKETAKLHRPDLRVDIELPKWLAYHVKDMIKGDERERIFEMELETNQGTRKMDVQITTIRDIEEKSIGMIVLYNDITERLHMINELKLASEKIRLLGDITRHDILNILTVLNGNIQLLEMKVKDPALEKYLKAVGDSSKDIQKLLESAKNYQKIGSQEPVWTRLHDVVSLGISSAELSDVIVHNEIEEDLEIMADPMLDRAFRNLAYNVRMHAPTAKNIWVKVERSGRDSIDVIFEDDGKGIAMEDKEKIFSEKFKGQTKHGLHFVQRLLQITDICIRENGEPGKGARFVLRVPKRRHRTVPQQRDQEK